MTNRKLKNKLREAFTHGTPDISQKIVLDTLFTEPQEQKEATAPVVLERKTHRFPIFSVAAAACAAIAVLAISINLITNRSQSGTAPYVSIDKALETVFACPSPFPITGVTPTVEWELDAESATPHYDVTLKYGDSVAYQYVVDAVTGEILSTNSHQLPILGGSITYLTEEQAQEIALADASLDISQVTKYTCNREIIDGVLHYRISFQWGNALYTYKINAVSGEIQDSYVLNAFTFITKSSAKTIALETVQLTEAEAGSFTVEFNSVEDRPYYKVLFVANNLIYQIEIDAITGYVLAVTTETVDITIPTPNVVIIQPLEIVLKHAGVTETEIVNLKCEEDVDDETPHIDISFIANELKYEYEVSGSKILDYETEPMEEDFISQDEALWLFDMALDADSKLLTLRSISFAIWEERMCYSITKSYAGGSDIRMMIDAETGEVLLKEIPDGLHLGNTTIVPPDGKLSADQAVTIALNHAGISSKELVSRLEIEVDADDEIPHYEISFHYQGYEYSYEIGMYNGGKILDAEKEIDD